MTGSVSLWQTANANCNKQWQSLTKKTTVLMIGSGRLVAVMIFNQGTGGIADRISGGKKDFTTTFGLALVCRTGTCKKHFLVREAKISVKSIVSRCYDQDSIRDT